MRANQNLDELAFRFFKLFAKYEATLKENGYFRERNGQIMVDWDRFANEVVGPHFRNELGDKAEAAEYILEHPPMKQAVDDDRKIIWKEVENTNRSVQALFGHIYRMRNNLFHGAKFNGTWFDPNRSSKLLENGLTLLEYYKDRIGRQSLGNGVQRRDVDHHQRGSPNLS